MRVIFGVILIAVGGWLAAFGVAYKNAPEVLFPLPGGDVLLGVVVPILSKVPFDIGVLLPFAVIGTLIGFSGLKMMTDGDKMEEQFEEIGDVSSEAKNQSAIPIGELVSMSQSTMEKEQFDRVISKLRPELVKYKLAMNEGAVEAMARIILQHAILHHQREGKKDISADQYQAQGKRMVEVENKEFARRYLPMGKATSEKMGASAGKVFDLNMQSKLEQEFLSEPRDWTTVTLGNLVEVMAKPISRGADSAADSAADSSADSADSSAASGPQ